MQNLAFQLTAGGLGVFASVGVLKSTLNWFGPNVGLGIIIGTSVALSYCIYREKHHEGRNH